MLNKLMKINKAKGFTLVEILIAIAISGVIITSFVAVYYQTVTITISNKNRMEAVKQVENALHWIDRDTQQANANSISPDDSFVTNFPLALSWTTFEGEDHDVVYNIESGNLKRSESIDGSTATVAVIARHIDSGSSNYIYDGKILAVNLTSTINGFRSASESRTLFVLPRVDN